MMPMRERKRNFNVESRNNPSRAVAPRHYLACVA